MEAQEKVELIQMAIQKLMMEGEEEEKMKNIVISSAEKRSFLPDHGKDDLNYNPQLLTKLLSQLETLKEGREVQQPSLSADHPEEVPSPEVGEKANRESETTSDLKDSDKEKVGEEIIKELRKVRRQNFITHCLLSAMIVLTVTWQLSEVSLILKVKDGMRHPFRSFGSLLTGMIKRPIQNAQNGVKQSESSALPPLSFPELPRMDLPPDLPGLVSTSDY